MNSSLNHTSRVIKNAFIHSTKKIHWQERKIFLVEKYCSVLVCILELIHVYFPGDRNEDFLEARGITIHCLRHTVPRKATAGPWRQQNRNSSKEKQRILPHGQDTKAHTDSRAVNGALQKQEQGSVLATMP